MEILLVGEEGMKAKEIIEERILPRLHGFLRTNLEQDLKIIREEEDLNDLYGNSVLYSNLLNKGDRELAVRAVEKIDGDVISVIKMKRNEKEIKEAFMKIVKKSKNVLPIEFYAYDDVHYDVWLAVKLHMMNPKFNKKILSVKLNTNEIGIQSSFVGDEYKEIGKGIGVSEFDLSEFDIPLYFGEGKEILKKLKEKLRRDGYKEGEKISHVPLFMTIEEVAEEFGDKIVKKAIEMEEGDKEDILNLLLETGWSEKVKEYAKKGVNLSAPIIINEKGESYYKKIDVAKKIIELRNENEFNKSYPVVIFLGPIAGNIGMEYLKIREKDEDYVVYFDTDTAHINNTMGSSFYNDKIYSDNSITLLLGEYRKDDWGVRDVEKGEEVIERDKELIESFIPNSDLYVVVAGTEKGTGSNAYKIVEMLKRREGDVITIITTPLEMENKAYKWYKNTKIGLKRLKGKSDLLIQIDMDKIYEVLIREGEESIIKVMDFTEEITAKLIKRIVSNYEETVEGLEGEYSIAITKRKDVKEAEKNKFTKKNFKPMVWFKEGEEYFVMGKTSD